jgi:hypothetical protein
MILCVAQIKGGFGKTLADTSTAAVLVQRGRDVSAERRRRSGQRRHVCADPRRRGVAAFATVQLYGAAIRQQIKALREKYAEIVIDVGGRDTGSLRAALTVADRTAIPFVPRSVDLWAGAKIAELVSEARDLNEELRAIRFSTWPTRRATTPTRSRRCIAWRGSRRCRSPSSSASVPQRLQRRPLRDRADPPRRQGGRGTTIHRGCNLRTRGRR